MALAVGRLEIPLFCVYALVSVRVYYIICVCSVFVDIICV